MQQDESGRSARRGALGAATARGVARAGMLAAALVAMSAAWAQPVEPTNGPRRTDPGWHALVGATLVPEPGRTIENATVVIRDGVIVSVESGAAPPTGARVWSLAGLRIYPGLIDAYVPVAAPAPDRKAPGAHWNPMVTAQRSALDGAGLDEAARKKLRADGFTVALVAPEKGVFRGTAAVVVLSDPPPVSDPLAGVLAASAAHAVGFDTSRFDEERYPNSKMGAIALIRQTLADVPWYREAVQAARRDPVAHPRPEPSDALLALDRPSPLLFDMDSELDVLRAAKIAGEFDRRAIIVASGREFRRLGAVVGAGLPLVVPLAYPEKPVVQTAADREAIGLRDLMTWEAAPTNAARLDAAGAVVALTSSKLPKDQKFFANLREAIDAGLSEERALALLTTRPAEILGLSDRVGRVAPGLLANLVVVKGSLFDEDREIRDVWIEGVRHIVNPTPAVELEGSWDATFEPAPGAAPVVGTLKVGKKTEVSFERDSTPADLAREQAEKEKKAAAKKDGAQDDAADAAAPGADAPAGDAPEKPGEKKRTFKARGAGLAENRLDFTLDATALGLEGEESVTLTAIIEDTMNGRGARGDGSGFVWRAQRSPEQKPDGGSDDEEKDKDASRFAGIPASFGLPFGPYALDAQPPQESLVLKAARVWTSGPAGIIENGVVALSGGKIVYVGQSQTEAEAQARKAAGAGEVRTLDLGARQITPGLIDAHSHTGISGGVNEGTQAVTAEVRIGDVVDPDAINWYRELAGGLTAVSQLHGSANPIGGQNSVVKIRWGVAHPDEMKIDGAIAGIKFALGENVKQSNWDNSPRTRYPQTRMGVETLIRDRFLAARDYAKAQSDWAALPEASRRGPGPRRDLELETLSQILAGERLVHCHSYRQDEILMLCRVAEEFGFKIGTFQHVLEGYKVAEAIREHAIGGSAFSDWWAYKYEVVDAIPSAGAIMHDVGVVVSFNSDSDELARRMNTEAAKAVKYGGVPPAEALMFVTLNPAKQLKIDGQTGSLEAGKDADLVVWSGDPLSTFSRCERTFVDGRELFSLERDRTLRAAAAGERSRILQKLLAKPKKSKAGGDDAKPKKTAVDAEEPIFGARSGRGSMLVPVGEGTLEEARARAAQLSLEREFMWLLTNGFDPYLWHSGDCGCSAQSVFGSSN